MDTDPDQSPDHSDKEKVTELEHEMEETLTEMEEEEKELEEKIQQTRADWEANRRDSSVPGAEPPEPEETEDGGS